MLTTASLGVYISLRYAEECTEGIKKGILFCIEVLVPSLYLFMALSSYIIQSGIVRTLTKPLGGLAHFLFRLPSQSLAVILLSILGGYPVGGRCTALLYEHGQLSEAQARRTAYIAVCAGPGFLLNYVGVALLNNRGAGTALLVSEIVGVLITGMTVGRMNINSDKTKAIREVSQINRAYSGESTEKAASGRERGSIIRSVTEASRATFHMCGMVILCAAITEVIAAVSPNPLVTDIASAIVEITTGCHRMCGSYPLPLIAFFIGFGGLSVHGQIFAGLGVLRISKGLFILYRIIQGIITALAAYTYLMISPSAQSVFSSTNAELSFSQSATLAGSAALIICSLCFLGSIRQKAVGNHNR